MEPPTLSTLTLQRGSLKGKLTRLSNYVQTYNSLTNSPRDLKVRYDDLPALFSKIENIQEQIEIIDNAEDRQLVHEQERENYEQKYYQLKAAMERLLFPSTLNSTMDESQNSQVGHTSQVKLPQLQLPTFDGTLKEWAIFKNIFKSTIDSAQIPVIHKFQYLKAALRGEASSLLSSLIISEVNYNKAWDILINRYENKTIIVNHHIKTFVNYPTITRYNLKEFLTSLQQSLDSLRSLDLPVDSWDVLLVFVITQKLDNSLRAAWEMNRKETTIPKFKDLLDFLNLRVTAFEMLTDKQIDKPNFSQPRMSHLVSVPNDCFMCNGPHKLHKCPSYLELPIPKRIEFVKSKCLCFNCLQVYQPKHFCSKNSCFTCHGKHHTSIHMDNPQPSPQRKVNYSAVAEDCFQPSSHNMANTYAYSEQTPSSLSTYSQQSNMPNMLPYSQQTNMPNMLPYSQQTNMPNMLPYNQQTNMPNMLPYSQQTNMPNMLTYSQQTHMPNMESHSQQTIIPSLQSHSQQTNTSSIHSHSQQTPNIANHIPQQHPSTKQQVHNSHTFSQPSVYETKTSTSTVMLTHTNAPQILLSTAIVNIQDSAGRWHKARALLDSGSEVNIMSHRLATSLQHKLEYNTCLIQGIGNIHKPTQVSATADIASRLKDYKRRLNFVVMDNITVPLPHTFINTEPWKIPFSQARTLADPTFFIPGNIDLLLGAEIFYDILQSGHIRLGNGMPQLIETSLGWIVSGSYLSDKNPLKSPQISLFATAKNTDEILCRFWEQEEVNPRKLLSHEQKYCETLYQDTTVQLESGHYMVNLPFLDNRVVELGNSLNTAYRCLLQLESRFQKDESLYKQYKDFIHEFIQLGHADYVPDFSNQSSHENSYYMPHHAVLKPDSQTTKLRTVFNASAKTSTGVSLNDILLEGPNIYNDLVDIILRFRLYQYTFTADIVKMFRNILVNPEHRPFQKLLWRDSKSDPLQCIQLSTVTYGTKCAPYLACRTLRDLAEKHKNEYPLAAECIQSDSYMDDFLSGGQSLQQVKELCTQLIQLLKTANFDLHKWAASHSDILKHVHTNLTDSNSHCYDFTPEHIVKTLGLKWIPSLDSFQIHIPEFENVKPTKRNILSQISQIFDPIGVLAVVTILGKMLMQDIWKLKSDWDNELPLTIQKKWFEFRSKLVKLRSIQIPRCYFAEFPLTITLIGFCDSSVKSFGGCLYLHATYNSREPTCNLVMAKTRVTSIKPQSIPRWELCSALILAQLTAKFLKAVGNKIHINDTILFTDSLVVLNWIKSPFSRKLNPFVSHRLMEIIETTQSENWHYINTKENPADFLTRGVHPDKLLSLDLWWHGPSWLLKEKAAWRLSSPSFPPDLESIETAPKINLHTASVEKHNYFYEIFQKYSSFSKIVRIIAFVRRFLNNLKNKQRNSSHLTVLELDSASKFIVKTVQEHSFPKEFMELTQLKSQTDSKSDPPQTTNLFTFKSSPLRKLNVFLDDQGLIRAGGRLTQSNIPYDHAHPIILPAKEHITALIVRYYHIKLLHAGTQLTLSTIRFKYWPINGRSQVKQVIHRCVRCIRFRAQTCEQQMADLPAPRVNLDRPFTHVGVDFSGAIYIRSSMARNCRYQKGYICLFVCLATKNLHLEIVSELTSQAFICALKRLVSRRGVCKCLYSDNATNFKGANSELTELYKMFKNETSYSDIVNYCAMNNIQWKFTVPLASHMGGIYEAGIKSVKALLKRQLCNAKLTYELMYTLLVQVEGILNSRPLCAISDSPTDVEYLTPSHFVLGSAITDLPEPNLSEMNENRLNMYQKITQIKQRIWKQFYNNYLSELLPRSKWLQIKSNVKVGDLILVKDEATPPACWPIGKVINVNRNSKDGLVRSVLLRTARGEYTRPIHKLVLLPSD